MNVSLRLGLNDKKAAAHAGYPLLGSPARQVYMCGLPLSRAELLFDGNAANGKNHVPGD